VRWVEGSYNPALQLGVCCDDRRLRRHAGRGKQACFDPDFDAWGCCNDLRPLLSRLPALALRIWQMICVPCLFGRFTRRGLRRPHSRRLSRLSDAPDTPGGRRAGKVIEGQVFRITVQTRTKASVSGAGRVVVVRQQLLAAEGHQRG
jgi:hypothetical protein